MKLIIAIIQDEDASEVISHLNEAKISGNETFHKGWLPARRQHHHYDRCGG